MDNNGWIKLHRSLLTHAVFANEKLLKVWIWCLLKASHKEYSTYLGLHKTTLEPGQFIFGERAASKELRIPPTSVRTYILILEKDGNLERWPSAKYTVISIKNYSQYQEVGALTERWPSADQALTETNKNVKNVKKYINTQKNFKEISTLDSEVLIPRDTTALISDVSTLRTIGLKKTLETKNSKNSRTPCTEQEIWEVAMKKRVSLRDVKQTHESILEAIEAREFKHKTIYFTLCTWLELNKKKGYVHELDEMGMADLQASTPEHLAYLARVVAVMREREARGGTILG